MDRVLAVDLGGTKTAIALVDRWGRISDREKLPAASDFRVTIEQILARSAQPVASVGVTVPGIYDPLNGTAWAPNLWGQEFHPILAALTVHMRMPVAIGSDRSASVLAEQWLGMAQGLQHVLFVAVGTGIGVGIVSGGRVIEGAHGIAGAAGWMVVGGRWQSHYADCGGWESEASGRAVARRGQMRSAEDVVAAARAGNEEALKTLHETADYLALGIANLIAIFDPEMVVLGGGLMQASDLILDRVRSQALRWTQPLAAKHARIEKTALGDDAGVLGAARLAWLKTNATSKTSQSEGPCL